MRCVIQRVQTASVDVDGARVAEIGKGLLVLAAVEKGDDDTKMAAAAKKIRELRIFADAEGKMNHDVAAIGGSILAVSQFTLAGSVSKGRRPSFEKAENPADAKRMFDLFALALSSTGISVQTGVFQVMMMVNLTNDGPVTFVYDL